MNSSSKKARTTRRRLRIAVPALLAFSAAFAAMNRRVEVVISPIEAETP